MDEKTRTTTPETITKSRVCCWLLGNGFRTTVVDPRSWRVSISIGDVVDSLTREGSHGKVQAL
jgi:hypothetical protein